MADAYAYELSTHLRNLDERDEALRRASDLSAQIERFQPTLELMSCLPAPANASPISLLPLEILSMVFGFLGAELLNGTLFRVCTSWREAIRTDFVLLFKNARVIMYTDVHWGYPRRPCEAAMQMWRAKIDTVPFDGKTRTSVLISSTAPSSLHRPWCHSVACTSLCCLHLTLLLSHSVACTCFLHLTLLLAPVACTSLCCLHLTLLLAPHAAACTCCLRLTLLLAPLPHRPLVPSSVLTHPHRPRSWRKPTPSYVGGSD
jgi:hypothetical protein